MRMKELEPVFVEFMPKQIEQGNLYISKRYGAATHLCACGCGTKTMTGINGELWSNRWDLIENDDKVTLHPSIGQRGGCQSHYWIKENKIVWC